MTNVPAPETPYVPQAIEQFVEGAASLWTLRWRLLSAPHVRLNVISRHDDRLEAFIDGLRIGGEAARLAVVDSLLADEYGALFAAGVLAAGTADQQLTEAVIKALETQESAWPQLVSALCWLDSSRAAAVLPRLIGDSRPHLRALGVAVAGARRTDPGPVLVRSLSDPDAHVRARAARTVGQLGRIDLMDRLKVGLSDPDPDCRFWSAWAAARMGATQPINVLADIAWSNQPRADSALDILLRRLDVAQANTWLRELARRPERHRSLLRATGIIGDPLYVPWLIERMAEPVSARLAGEAFSMITGVDLASSDFVLRPPPEFPDGPNDDPADEDVALDEDASLPWPDPARVDEWWSANRGRFTAGTDYFLGTPKNAADWFGALSDAYQRQRHSAALELAIRQPAHVLFEVRAQARLQRKLLVHPRGA